jgi:hypothetical protein
MVLFLILELGGDVREIDRKVNSSFKLDESLSLTSIKGVIQNKGKSKLERLVIWHDNDTDIHVYGYKSGTSEIINRHCPPKPLDKMELYGDILMIACANDKIVDMNETMYLDLFNEMMDDGDNNSEQSNDFNNDILPEDAELVTDDIVYDFNSEGSNEHTLEIIEANDDDEISCDIEIRYDIELEIEQEFLG